MDIYKHITKSSREKLADEFQKHINFSQEDFIMKKEYLYLTISLYSY